MRARQLAAISLAAVLGGCVGAIGDAPEQPTPQVVTTPILAKGGSSRALSIHEYRNTLAALLGQAIPASLFANWQPTTTYSGFDGVIWSGFSAKATQDRIATVEALLDSVVASPKVMVCEDATDPVCVERIIRTFASRAYRRPVTDLELTELLDRYAIAYRLASSDAPSDRDRFYEGIRVTLGSVLLSPQLLVRLEPAPQEGERDLDAYELASRLAFFMTGAPPDDELWGLAESGAIVDVDTLRDQAKRLLATRTQDFVDTFAGQLYDFRALDSATADTLQGDFYRESSMVFGEIIDRDLPATSLLSPGFTYVNGRLAYSYGLGTGHLMTDAFERIATKERGGILQQGAMLSLTSTPVKTSPTRRGRWVQGRLLCKTIPPPGPDLLAQIAAVSEGIPANATVKQRVDAHRSAGPACTSCHQYMDPIGLGLEGFNMLGQKRIVYENTGLPVEVDSEFLGTSFQTFDELNALIAANDAVGPCIAEKMVIHGLGQMIADSDRGLIDYLSSKTDDHDPSFADLVTRFVTSTPFRRITATAALQASSP